MGDEHLHQKRLMELQRLCQFEQVPDDDDNTRLVFERLFRDIQKLNEQIDDDLNIEGP